MSRGMVPRLLAILLGVALFAAGAELFCRVAFEKITVYDVEMWRYARQLKVSGVTPGLRFEHRPGGTARLMGVDVRINADGLREREIGRERRSGTLRIALVGDSITFGWGVAQDRTWSRQLENLLNRERPLGPAVAFEVLNFGVGNYTILDAADMLVSKALPYRPDLVVYGAFVNDAEPPVENLSGNWLMNNSVAAVWIWGRLDRLARALGWRDDYLAYYRGLYEQGGAGRRRVQDGLALMASRCRERGIPLVVAMLPELHVHQGDPFRPMTDYYRQSAAATGTIFVDLDGVLPKNARRNFWVSGDDAHPNAEAFGWYARGVAAAIPWEKIGETRVKSAQPKGSR